MAHVVERLADGQIALDRHRHREVDAASEADLKDMALMLEGFFP